MGPVKLADLLDLGAALRRRDRYCCADRRPVARRADKIYLQPVLFDGAGVQVEIGGERKKPGQCTLQRARHEPLKNCQVLVTIGVGIEPDRSRVNEPPERRTRPGYVGGRELTVRFL